MTQSLPLVFFSAAHVVVLLVVVAVGVVIVELLVHGLCIAVVVEFEEVLSSENDRKFSRGDRSTVILLCCCGCPRVRAPACPSTFLSACLAACPLVHGGLQRVRKASDGEELNQADRWAVLFVCLSICRWLGATDQLNESLIDESCRKQKQQYLVAVALGISV